MSPEFLTPPDHPSTLLCPECGSTQIACTGCKQNTNGALLSLLCKDCEARILLSVGSSHGTIDVAIVSTDMS